jgi:hypothetical protein
VPRKLLPPLHRQLAFPPVLCLTEAERDATESQHQERLPQYLGYRLFDDTVQDRLTRW